MVRSRSGSELSSTAAGAHLTGRSSERWTLVVTTIDKEALKAKYAEERDKRLRPDGNDQ